MTSKLWKYILKNKIICTLNLIIFLILVLPHSYSFSNHYQTEVLHWVPIFMFKEIDLFIIYSPIFILTIGFQIANKVVLKKTLLILNIIACFLHFLMALFPILFTSIDFSSGIGNLLTLTLFPLSVIIYTVEFSK